MRRDFMRSAERLARLRRDPRPRGHRADAIVAGVCLVVFVAVRWAVVVLGR